jgi:transcriptional regulator with XRE-family HTH domain
MPRISKSRLPETPFYRDLGRNIRLTRNAAGRSQEEAAEHIDVSFQQFQKYEKGANRIPVDKLVSLADFLDVPLSKFVGKTDSAANSAVQSLIEEYSGRECQSLLKSFTTINDRRIRSAILNFVRSMAALNGRGSG